MLRVWKKTTSYALSPSLSLSLAISLSLSLSLSLLHMKNENMTTHVACVRQWDSQFGRCALIHLPSVKHFWLTSLKFNRRDECSPVRSGAGGRAPLCIWAIEIDYRSPAKQTKIVSLKNPPPPPTASKQTKVHTPRFISRSAFNLLCISPYKKSCRLKKGLLI